MAKQLGFLVNLHRCVGCKSCELSCKNQHQFADNQRRRVVALADDQQQVLSFLSMSCNHCYNPACMGVCPNKCYKKRRDGIVVLNNQNCSGCESCVGACPYGAPKINKNTNKIDKCNLCIGDKGDKVAPACVSGCVTHALQLVDINTLTAEQIHKVVPGIKMVSVTNPAVRFILPQETKCFWRD